MRLRTTIPFTTWALRYRTGLGWAIWYGRVPDRSAAHVPWQLGLLTYLILKITYVMILATMIIFMLGILRP